MSTSLYLSLSFHSHLPLLLLWVWHPIDLLSSFPCSKKATQRERHNEVERYRVRWRKIKIKVGNRKRKIAARQRDGNIWRESKLDLSSSVHFGCVVNALVCGQARWVNDAPNLDSGTHYSSPGGIWTPLIIWGALLGWSLLLARSINAMWRPLISLLTAGLHFTLCMAEFSCWMITMSTWLLLCRCHQNKCRGCLVNRLLLKIALGWWPFYLHFNFTNANIFKSRYVYLK